MTVHIGAAGAQCGCHGENGAARHEENFWLGEGRKVRNGGPSGPSQSGWCPWGGLAVTVHIGAAGARLRATEERREKTQAHNLLY